MRILGDLNRWPHVLAWALLAGLAGCAAMPRPGESVTVAVSRPLTMQDWTSNDQAVANARPALRAAGIDADAIAQGRVLRVHCAVMSDGWWDSLAVLPPGFGPVNNQALRLQVHDTGDNDRLAVNPVLARATLPLGPGGPAYDIIPDWRARGLSRNYQEKPPDGGPRAAYLIVQGSWLVRCRQ